MSLHRNLSFRVLLVSVVTWSGIAILAQPALAQKERPKRETVQLVGTIEGIERGVAKVIDAQQAEWYVKMEPKGTFSYSGSAEADWLKRGMWVRFTTKFNAEGEPQEMLRDVVVFQPKKDDKLGIYSNQSGATFKNPFTKSLADDIPESERLKSYTVAGRLKGVKKDELSVQAGRLTLSIPIDERTKYRVEVPDPSLIRQGDDVTIRGWKVPNAENAVMASSLTVTAKEPLGKPKKKSGGDKQETDTKDKSDS